MYVSQRQQRAYIFKRGALKSAGVTAAASAGVTAGVTAALGAGCAALGTGFGSRSRAK